MSEGYEETRARAEKELMKPLRVGDVLEGFCEGYFGRDSYGDKTVVFVAEPVDGYVLVAVTESVWTDEVGNLLVLRAYSGDPSNLVRNRR